MVARISEDEYVNTILPKLTVPVLAFDQITTNISAASVAYFKPQVEEIPKETIIKFSYKPGDNYKISKTKDNRIRVEKADSTKDNPKIVAELSEKQYAYFLQDLNTNMTTTRGTNA